MGIGDWVRRFFGSASGMPGTIPCALCRCEIPLSHFEKGIAVMVARKHYCRGCTEEITRSSKSSGLALDLGSSSTVLLK